MSGISLGQSSGKVVSGGGEIKETAKPIDNMTLTFNYTGGQWVFSLNNITPDFQNLLSKGYSVYLQTIRYIGGKSGSYFSKKRGNMTGDKKSNNLSLNVTSSLLSNPQNILATTLLNNIIFNDQFKVYGRVNQTADALYNTTGKWFRKYKFCLVINNVSYTNTGDLFVSTNNLGPISGTINPNYSYSNGNVDIFPL
jgi:hypothetical protein